MTPPKADSQENFPVALRVLPPTVRRHLGAVYTYARFLDDLGDEPDVASSPAARLAELDLFEAQLRDLYEGNPVRHPVLHELAPTAVACGLPIDPLARLIEANRIDQIVSRYGDFDQLIDYCKYSANPVGELVLYVFDQVSDDRLALSDHICTGLQIIEHLQDVAEDWHRDRLYLPKEDLDRFGVALTDLDLPRAPQHLRDLISFEAERARALLDAGAPLVSTLRGSARLAVSGYLAGGRAALAALARARYDPMAGPPRASRAAVFAQWLRASVRSAG